MENIDLVFPSILVTAQFPLHSRQHTDPIGLSILFTRDLQDFHFKFSHWPIIFFTKCSQKITKDSSKLIALPHRPFLGLSVLFTHDLQDFHSYFHIIFTRQISNFHKIFTKNHIFPVNSPSYPSPVPSLAFLSTVTKSSSVRPWAWQVDSTYIGIPSATRVSRYNDIAITYEIFTDLRRTTLIFTKFSHVSGPCKFSKIFLWKLRSGLGCAQGS